MTSNPTDLIELLPCPFCGNAPNAPTFSHESGALDVWEIECETCCYSIEGGRSPSGQAEAAAIGVWNTRPAANTLTQQEAVLRDVMPTLSAIRAMAACEDWNECRSHISGLCLDAMTKIAALSTTTDAPIDSGAGTA